MQAKPPRNEHELELALVRRAGNSNKQAKDDRTTMANAIVAQMLGEGVAVKGGSMLRFRYGSKNSRYTMDFDATRKIDLDAFIKGFRERLSAGWNGFTGEADILPQASPVGVPFDYVMQPIKVKLKYKNNSWCSVNLEISLGEAGCADCSDDLPPNEETVTLFSDLGFPPPSSVRTMRLEHQFAQKLRGLSGLNSRRAHDLINLQLMMLYDGDRVDLKEVGSICEKIFRNPGMQPWPPTIVPLPNWDTLYKEQIADLPVAKDVATAIKWANSLVSTIVNLS